MAFYSDLERGHEGESAVKNKLESYGYKVVNIADNPEYFYQGDLFVYQH